MGVRPPAKVLGALSCGSKGARSQYSNARRSNAMQYKGIQYQVVQTPDATKWQWTVDLGDGGTKTGRQPNGSYRICTEVH
jgi:hypothetical protein